MIFADFLLNRRREQLSDQDLAALEASVSQVRKTQARQIIARAGEPISCSTYLMDGFICRYKIGRASCRERV